MRHYKFVGALDKNGWPVWYSSDQSSVDIGSLMPRILFKSVVEVRLLVLAASLDNDESLSPIPDVVPQQLFEASGFVAWQK